MFIFKSLPLTEQEQNPFLIFNLSESQPMRFARDFKSQKSSPVFCIT